MTVEIPEDAGEMLEEEYHEPDETHWVVEEMPVFPNGQAALLRFLTTNLNYPPDAVQKNIQGQVVCQFTVNKDGSISDIEVVSGVNPSLDKEALRVLQMMPHWTPGKRQGKTVKVRYTLPIDFRL